jgi:agmatinase
MFDPSTDFDPSGPGLNNGSLYGLPFTLEEASMIVIPIPWDTTVSYRSGTAAGPAAILEASTQVEIYDQDLQDAWKAGIFMLDIPQDLEQKSKTARLTAEKIIQGLEAGESIETYTRELQTVNQASLKMNTWVEDTAKNLLQQGKIPVVLGGDHSTPLGLMRALGQKHSNYGILQIDAHMDLREAYEGFTYSHASIMWNARKIPAVSQLVQVGVRDYCDEEVKLVQENKDQISYFSYRDIARGAFKGQNWAVQVSQMVDLLPEKVYISFDIDGLDPALCPDTGTPVPGGLSFEEALFLVDQVVASGREIIGFDLCEVAPGNNEWNATVGARVLYRLYVATIKSKLKA